MVEIKTSLHPSPEALDSEQNHIEVEHRTEGEIIIPRFDVLTIGGSSGLHKSTIARMLAGVDNDERNAEAQYKFHLDGIPVPFQVGQLVRAEAEARTGKPFIQDSTVPIEEDRRIDDGIRNIIENIRKPQLVVTRNGLNTQLRDAAIIIEARFVHIIAADVDEQLTGKKYSPRTERVLIYSSDEEERIATEVEREKSGTSSRLSKKALGELGIAREQELNQKAHALFPEIVNGQYIYDKEMLTRKGNLVFTIAVDAKGKKPPELLAEIYKELYERNALVVVSKKNFANSPEGESAFELIKGLNRCQGLLEDNPCNRFGIKTLDVYNQKEGLLVQVAACSNEHARNIQQRILNTGESQYFFSRNGHEPQNHYGSTENSNSSPKKGVIFIDEEIEAKEEANIKVKFNGKNIPNRSFGEKLKNKLVSSKDNGDSANKRRNFPKKHPNLHHPSRNRKQR